MESSYVIGHVIVRLAVSVCPVTSGQSGRHRVRGSVHAAAVLRVRNGSSVRRAAEQRTERHDVDDGDTRRRSVYQLAHRANRLFQESYLQDRLFQPLRPIE